MVKNPAKYKPYPAYRPSGVEWLGEVPANWEVKRLKYVATFNDEALPEDTYPDTDITYVDIGNVDSIRGSQPQRIWCLRMHLPGQGG